jgi:predicted GNAT family acetyltransferase
MEPEVAIAVVDAIADSGNSLPGVNGDAATAAIFAGRWTERRRSAAVPTQGQRLYELGRLNEIATVEGRLRKADARDRSLAVRWLREFDAEAHVPERDIESFIDTALLSQRVWLWDAEGAASMAISSKPVEGVVRLSGVYTPRENRTCGYAAACVHGLSSLLVDAGYRCILYTDLGNPTSNSIYRRIGYKAVSEGICYRFDEL